MSAQKSANASTGRSLVAIGRFITAHRWGVAPLIVSGAALILAGMLSLIVALVGSSAWWWIGGGYLTGAALLAAWLISVDSGRLIIGSGFASAALVAVGLSVWPTSTLLWSIWGYGTLILGGFWWFSNVVKRAKKSERTMRKGERLAAKLGTKSQVTKTILAENGDITWRFYLGDDDSAEAFDAAKIAHIWDIARGRVIVSRPNADAPRTVTVRRLAHKPSSKRTTSGHPALEAKSVAPGGSWEPGTRSILNPIPVGPAIESDDVAMVKLLTSQGDPRHLLMLGQTGNGKSVSASTIAAGVLATRDAVMGAADISKAGATFRPFEAGLQSLALTPEALLADLQGLYQEAARRCELISRGLVVDDEGEEVDKWIPRSNDPTIVYCIEELGTTMERIESQNSKMADQIWSALESLAGLCRQGGIILFIITQKAQHEVMSTNLRSHLGNMIVHKMNQHADMMGLWKAYPSVDVVGALSAVGMSYIGDADGGSDPLLSRAYPLLKPKQKRAITATYLDSQAQLPEESLQAIGWGTGASTTQAQEQTTVEPAQESPATSAKERFSQLVADFAADPASTLPAGAPLVTDDNTREVGDDALDADILDYLADAGQEGARRSELEDETGRPTKTLQRRLQGLAAEDRIELVGRGKASKWRLNSSALTAA